MLFRSTREDLIAIAATVGISEAQVDSAITSQEFANQVLSDQSQARQYGANGVPFFVIDNKYGISGAQPQEVFDQTLTTALKERN